VAAARKGASGTRARATKATKASEPRARTTGRTEPATPGIIRRVASGMLSGLGRVLSDQQRDVVGILLLLAAVISGLGVYLDAAGPVGQGIDTFARGGFGLVGYLLPALLLSFGVLLFVDRTGPEVGRIAVGTFLLTLAVLAGSHLVVDIPGPGQGVDVLAGGGGLVGWALAAPLDAALSRAGAWAFVVALALLGAVVTARIELRTVVGWLVDRIRSAGRALRALFARDADGRVAGTETPAAQSDTYTAVPLGLDTAPNGVSGVAPDDGIVDVAVERPRAVVDVWLDDDPQDSTVELPAADVGSAPTEAIVLERGTPPDTDDTDGTDASGDVDPVGQDMARDAARDAAGDAAGDAGDGSPAVQKARKVLPPGEERPYELPPLDLLSSGRALGGDPSRTIEAQTRALQETFDQFGINATVARSSRGPTVTRFEVELGPGVKVNKVANLGDDIAYALAAPDVRIVAPIPGKSAIGIEVPNTERDLISLGDVLRSDVARRDTHPLSVALGVDIAGAPAMVDLTRMPHLLVSGSTGSGKSVTLNGMIASIIMRARPDQVRMLLIDPKRVELGVYEGAPHLLAPVVTDPRRAADAVAWCVKEMEQRYELLALLGFRNIDGYNDAHDRGDLKDRPGPDGSTIPPKRLPYILLVIDELADLMLVAPRDVEDAICRIAQMARAVGIHMVIATQRPSVDVITGLIKANIPSRLALAVASQTDSRTILDAGGAEKLVGRGDMLFLPASQGKPSRMQGCWVTEEEIASVVAYCRTQREPAFEEAVASAITASPGARSGAGRDGDDEGDAGLVRRAAEQVVSSGLGSTSMLQRKLRVGFARAGRLMDELEEVGCVGPSEGSKAREVLWDEARLQAALESGLI